MSVNYPDTGIAQQSKPLRPRFFGVSILSVILAALAGLSAFACGLTSQSTAVCQSLLGQVARALDSGTAQDCTVATSGHTVAIALAIVFALASVLIAWRRSAGDPAVSATATAVGIVLLCAVTVIAGSAVSSRLAADAARAQVAAAAARQAQANAQAAAQAQAQASAQAAQDQITQIGQDQSTLDTDLATLVSDTAAVQQGKTLADDVQTMKNDLATEQSDKQQGFCGGDASIVSADLDSLNSDIATLQQDTTLSDDISTVRGDAAMLQNDGATPVTDPSAAIAAAQNAIQDTAKAITWAQQQGQSINGQANALGC